MKYKIQITPEGDKYIGYAIGEGGEVAFKTTPCRLATAASKELTKLIKYNRPELNTDHLKSNSIIESSLTQTFFMSNPTTSQTTQEERPPINPQPIPEERPPIDPQPAPKKCCGRG